MNSWITWSAIELESISLSNYSKLTILRERFFLRKGEVNENFGWMTRIQWGSGLLICGVKMFRYGNFTMLIIMNLIHFTMKGVKLTRKCRYLPGMCLVLPFPSLGFSCLNCASRQYILGHKITLVLEPVQGMTQETANPWIIQLKWWHLQKMFDLQIPNYSRANSDLMPLGILYWMKMLGRAVA